jgi:hypothetical protein
LLAERERPQIANLHPTLDKSAQRSATDISDVVGRTEAQRAKEEELKNEVKSSGLDGDGILFGSWLSSL